MVFPILLLKCFYVWWDSFGSVDRHMLLHRRQGRTDSTAVYMCFFVVRPAGPQHSKEMQWFVEAGWLAPYFLKNWFSDRVGLAPLWTTPSTLYGLSWLGVIVEWFIEFLHICLRFGSIHLFGSVCMWLMVCLVFCFGLFPISCFQWRFCGCVLGSWLECGFVWHRRCVKP